LGSPVVVGHPPEKVGNKSRTNPQRIESGDMKDGVEGGHDRRCHNAKARSESPLQNSSEVGLVSRRVEEKNSRLKVDRISGRRD